MATRPAPLLLCALLSGVGCLPAFDNPFDPLNSPDGAVRLSSVAQVGRDAVKVTWTAIDHPAINGWRLSRTNVGGTEGAADRVDALALSTLEWVDATATAGATYKYTLVALAGETFSAPSPGVQVTVEAPPVLAVSVERTGVGEATVRWSPLPAWASNVFVEQVCPDGSCEPKAVGTVEATALAFVDAMDEGPTLAWRLTAEDGTGARLDETAATTELFSFSLNAPYPDAVRRAIEDPSIVDVAFTPLPYAARYEGTLAPAQGAGSPAIVDSNADEFHFTGLDANADYLLTVRAIGPNDKAAIPYGPARIRARTWHGFQPDRPVSAAPTGTRALLALLPQGNAAPMDTLSLVGLTPDPASGLVDLAVSHAPVALRGGFTAPQRLQGKAFRAPVVPVTGGGFLWVSPLSARAVSPLSATSLRELSVGGQAPPVGRLESAAAVNPDDDSIWILGGRDGDVPVSDLRRAVLAPQGDSIQWSLQATPEGLDARSGHAIAFHDGALYVLGGSDGSSVLLGNPPPFFARWTPGDSAATVLTDPNGAGPTDLTQLHLASDGVRLWAAGGFSAVPGDAPTVWSWKQDEGWVNRGAGALGPRPSGHDWAVVPWEFREGPGVFIYDGIALLQLEPVSDSLSQFRWVRADAPPAASTFSGTYDIDNNRVYLRTDTEVWRFTPEDGVAWSRVAQSTGAAWPEGRVGWDPMGRRLLSYGGGGSVETMQPDDPSPTFTRLLSAAGGPPALAVGLVEVGMSLQDFSSPTLFAAGASGDPPEPQAWSVKLDGSEPWRRYEAEAPPGLVSPDSCVGPPLFAWDPRGPSVYVLGATEHAAGRVTYEAWSVNLSTPSPAWQRALARVFDGACTRVEALAVAHGESALYAFGTREGKPSTWRLPLDAGDWDDLPILGGLNDPGTRSAPVLLRRHPWNDLLMFGGRTPVGHDVWQLETR